MTDKIEPALTPKQWQTVDVADVRGWDDGSIYVGRSNDGDWNVSKKPHALIAILNAALPDSDPRKITRAWVETLRSEAVSIGTGGLGRGDDDDDEPYLTMAQREARLNAIADALESYLPPEPS